MKWFKHYCDMRSDLKVQVLMERHGLVGYALWNLCLELVGQQGKGGRIYGRLRWREQLKKISQWSKDDDFDGIMATMAELRLIDPKALNYGNLYIPKILKRLDDYTSRKLRMNSEQYPNLIERLHKLRNKYVEIKQWSKDSLMSSDYARMHRQLKELMIKAQGNDEMVIKAIEWISNQGYTDWTLVTVNKKFPDFVKRQQSINAQVRYGEETRIKMEKMKQEAKADPIDPKKLKTLMKGIGEI